MLLHLFADIAFPTAVRRLFTYKVNETDQYGTRPGMRAWVPLRNRMAIGMIVRIHENRPEFRTKSVKKLLDNAPVMSPEMIRLTEWVHQFYYASWGETIQAALPAGLNFVAEAHLRLVDHQAINFAGKIEAEIIEAIVESENGNYLLAEAEKRWGQTGANLIKKLVKKKVIEIWEEPRLKVNRKMETLWQWKSESSSMEAQNILHNSQGGKIPKWVKALTTLPEIELPAPRSVVMAQDNVTDYTLKKIEKEGFLETIQVPASEVKPPYEFDPSKIKKLNEQQEKVFAPISEAIEKGEFANHMIYGVTGSGKTEIYIHALKKAVSLGKGALILVPEIALTPQTVKRFYQIFGDAIAVLHSRLNDHERFEAWKSLREGRKKIAIGARSAVFAPIENLGLVMIDEEHDSSYKQEDPSPRYHARDVAIMRAWQNKGVVVMGSATPSMVSLRLTTKGKSKMLELPGRHAASELPEVKVLDMKQYRNAMRGSLAVPLFLDIEKAIGKKDQVILLYNRRGFASYLHCKDCGHIAECPHCSVTLTYHKFKSQLRCHYCGFSQFKYQTCTECGSEAIEEKGSGTQKIEEEIGELFPAARLLRMDQDTTSGKHAHEQILKQFGDGEADILIGTQVVAKGLNFPNVTVVGVINSDTELAFPSYRSGERMFQMLSQVAGRSGRGSKPGKVYLQTTQPEHPAIVSARNHDYKTFARQEMQYRKMLLYPPFSRLLKIQFKSVNEQLIAKVADIFSECLREAGNNAPVLGPAPSAVMKIQKNFIWECYLKLKPENGASAIEKLLDEAFALYEKRKPARASQVRVTVNVDAV
ncbi:MAG: primosomal protein N' [Balneolales bacterium]